MEYSAKSVSVSLFVLKESAIPAFFTRSSAANIPINMELAKAMDLNEESYAVSIPLGATINMGGAAITITIMTLAAVHTLGMSVPIYLALLLSIIAAVSAGASGIAGGSLLLIPLACSLFGISNDIAMQVVGVGFIVGVVQDSIETALNSSSDLLFTTSVELADRRKNGESIDVKALIGKSQLVVEQERKEQPAKMRVVPFFNLGPIFSGATEIIDHFVKKILYNKGIK